MSHDTELVEQACCANCGAELSGAYCHNCGQSAHTHRSVWHMLEEFLHGVLHFDSKAWRTLPALLVHPGQLTRDYIHGKRTRYVSPFILFLFLNFVMFFLFSYLGGNLTHDESYKSHIKSGMVNELHITQTRLAELNVNRASLPPNDKTIPAIEQEVIQLRQKQTGIEESMQAIRAEDGFENNGDSSNSKATLKENRLPQNLSDWTKQMFNHALKNPDLVLYKLKGAASKFAFILIPLSLPFLWLLFITRKDVVVYDHGVFSLYSLSFTCLLLMLVATLGRFGLSWAWLVLIIMPLHMFAQLRGAYQLTNVAALWRTVVLLCAAAFSLSIYFILIAWRSL